MSIDTCFHGKFRSANQRQEPNAKLKSKRSYWRPRRNVKLLLALAIIAVILISSFVFLFSMNKPRENLGGITIATNSPTPTTLPTPTPTTSPQTSSSNQSQDVVSWSQVAANAWAYFQVDVGVDGATGLPFAGGPGFEAFTDWDLAAYIQAIIDAQELGLVNATGVDGSDWRIDKVLTFLETRPLNTTTDWPFWFYDATTGQGYLTTSVYASDSVDIPDTGALLIALSNLAAFNSSLTQRIDNIVYDTSGNRSNYAALLPTIENDASSDSAYNYYYDSGFAQFWPSQVGDIPSKIMANILDASTITTCNVTLPDAPLICEPLVLAIFQLQNNTSGVALSGLMKQLYLANEGYFEATGNWAAFSEGTSTIRSYVYEWVVGPSGDAWEITDTSSVQVGITPVAFTKIAYSFLALYNTTYARDLVYYLQQKLSNTKDGYFAGVDTSGNLDTDLDSETNSIILDAALYQTLNSP